LDLSPDAQFALSAGNDSPHLVQWDVAAAQPIDFLKGHSYPILSAEFSRDGKLAVAGGFDGTIKLWDLASTNLICSLGPVIRGTDGKNNAPAGITSVAFSPDGMLTVSGMQNNHVQIWDFSRSVRQHELAGRLFQARTALEKQPSDPASDASFGQWYASRGADAWAIELLERARQAGEPVSPLLLAQCNVRIHQYPEALTLYQEALNTHEAGDRYLLLCVAALQRKGPGTNP